MPISLTRRCFQSFAGHGGCASQSSRWSLLTWSAVAIPLLCGIGSAQVSRPTFADYRVTSIYAGPTRPPRLGRMDRYTGTDLRCFGEDPTTYAAMPVNFAGHFVLGQCSCGSGCSYLYLWDARTGAFYRDLPFGPLDVGPYGDLKGHPVITYAGASYRADSSLLILDGCFEGTCDCAKRFYVWKSSVFQLIQRQPGRVPRKCGNR